MTLGFLVFLLEMLHSAPAPLCSYYVGCLEDKRKFPYC